MAFFNKLKSTEAIEKERLQLWNDFQTYQEVENSAELKTYLALKEKVESKPFLKHKHEVESLRYKGSPEEKMVRQYQKLQKHGKLKRYFSCLESGDFERYNQLQEKIKSSGRKDVEELGNSVDLKFYQQFSKSKAYKNYLAIRGSSLLNQYEDLKTEIESEKFKQRKAYLENNKRYEETEEYKLLAQFNELDKNPKIQLYLKYNDTDAFKFYRDWTPTFTENFDKIDPKIWSTVTPIAQKGPGRNFSMKQQLHYAKGLDNFDYENGILTLETQKENVEGLYWDENYGFVPKTFSYTSGLIHTIDGFMQEYGLFEVKVKSSKVKGVLSSISLVDGDEDICIRILSANHTKPNGGLITTNHQTKHYDSVLFNSFSKGYVLVRLIWTREKLEWFVNDKHMGSISSNVPHIPLALRIESEVLKETNNLPHRLDIDWIKCYRSNY